MRSFVTLSTAVALSACGSTDSSNGNSGIPSRTASVSIVGPAMACVGDPASFRASTVVSDDGAVMIEWFVEGAPAGTGAMFETSFDEVGMPRIFVEVTDGSGVLANDALDFEVVSCGGNAAPMITEVSWPSSDIQAVGDEDFTYEWTGPAMDRPGEFVRRITPTAVVMDAEDGSLTGEALEWTTDQTTVQDPLLGTGVSPELSFFGDCFGQTHTVTLTATDAGGETSSQTFELRFYTLCLQ